MKHPLAIAIGIQAIIMLSVFVPPLLTRATGTEIYLQTERVDPRDIFRGDYVVLSYPLGRSIPKDVARKALETGDVIYVTVTTDRPAKYVAAGVEKPDLKAGQACIIARPDESLRWMLDDPVTDPGFPAWNWAHFPQIGQFFVAEGTGHDIETDLNKMVARIKATSGCNAVVVDLELL